jgi:hypothetical protein
MHSPAAARDPRHGEKQLLYATAARPAGSWHDRWAIAAHRRMWRRNITIISLFSIGFLSSHCGHHRG